MSKKRTAEEWRQIIEAWRASGLTQKVFAAQHHLTLHSLRWWAWNLGGNQKTESTTRSKPLAQSSSDALQFLPVRIEERQPTSPLRIRVDGLPLTVEVEQGFSRALLLDLLDALC